jgi:sigma-54-specific transcriptional regulator
MNEALEMVCEDPASKALRAALALQAQHDGIVCLRGEPGTGKGFIARWLHARSRRASAPFVAIDCAALDPDAQAVAITGHASGAVKGGFAAVPGWFELAQGGTLFLDEWAGLSRAAQQTLWTVWRHGHVSRLGSSLRTPINVRLVLASSATHGAAEGLPDQPGSLTPETVCTLNVPRLTQRPADILPLARHFLQAHALRLRQPVRQLSPEAERCLVLQPWPGHLRELQAVLQRASVQSTTNVIGLEQLGLPCHPAPRPECQLAAAQWPLSTPTSDQLLAELEGVLQRLGDAHPGQLHELVDRQLFAHAHRRSGGHQIKAAELLGVSRNVLRGRLIALGLIDARR